MEGLQKFYDDISREAKSAAAASASRFSEIAGRDRGGGGGGGGGVSGASTSYYESGVLVKRVPRAVSLLTCSKLCAVFFVAGVIAGYTLKGQVRRWASKLLRRLKDD